MTARTGTNYLTTYQRTSIGDSVRPTAARHRICTTWLVPAIYAGCLAAFIADLTSVDTLAFGVFYVPLVATAVFRRDKRAVWVLTAIAFAMVTIGTFVPAIAANLTELLWNRALSLCAILATAMFVWQARSIQDQLAEQTSRAEAAERIKAEVLTNLSEEIRAPLYSMIGVLELAAADSRPEQRAALEMVRGSGRRLVATVDNLVDLTQLEDRSMPAEPVDLGQLLRQTAESAKHEAGARQIELIIDIPCCGVPPGRDAQVRANRWAARRILENKIADAIAHTAPGGRIEVSTALENEHVSAVIASTSRWPPAATQSATDLEVAPMLPSVMGQALSQRLARAIGARLVFGNGPGDGTTVRLRLPSIAAAAPGSAASPL
jgi:signal transduction histidine kinase